jgi:hypothetical protein
LNVQHDLDHKLRALKDKAIDYPLDGLAGDVNQLIVDRAANLQTWSLRAAAIAVVTATGVAISASSTSMAAQQAASPFSAWSRLAPSTLLETPE